MKRIINVLFAAFLLSLLSTTYASAQWTLGGLGYAEGLAVVHDGKNGWVGKWGYIDKKGKLVIPCKWESADNFSEGLASVQDDNYKWGFIDKTGKVVIPCKWKFAGKFSEGLASVKDANEKWGFIDKTGKVVIPCQWEMVHDFDEGVAAVLDANNTWYLIDKTGKIVK